MNGLFSTMLVVHLGRGVFHPVLVLVAVLVFLLLVFLL